MAKKTVLVTGANGQVGQELNVIHASYPDFDFLFTTRKELDIVNAESVNNFFSSHKIDIVINCAAYTAVDKAESDKENAQKVNAEAVKELVKACGKSSALLIHISTDFVFDGTKSSPYKESDNTNPLGVYGATKLEGEKEALKYRNSIVVRTSWVYSSFGHNFVKTMLRLGKEKPELRVVNDQQGSPTYAKDLAEALLYIASNYSANNLQQVYHYSNEGAITWFEFARTILELSHIETPVHPITTAQFPTPAKRPSYSVMDKGKILEAFPGIPFKNWKTSLAECLRLIS